MASILLSSIAIYGVVIVENKVQHNYLKEVVQSVV